MRFYINYFSTYDNYIPAKICVERFILNFCQFVCFRSLIWHLDGPSVCAAVLKVPLKTQTAIHRCSLIACEIKCQTWKLIHSTRENFPLLCLIHEVEPRARLFLLKRVHVHLMICMACRLNGNSLLKKSI